MEKWNSRQRPSFTGDHRSRMNSWTFPADLFFLFCIPNERPTGREGGVNACHFLSTALWEVMMRCRTDSLTIPIIFFLLKWKKNSCAKALCFFKWCSLMRHSHCSVRIILKFRNFSTWRSHEKVHCDGCFRTETRRFGRKRTTSYRPLLQWRSDSSNWLECDALSRSIRQPLNPFWLSAVFPPECTECMNFIKMEADAHRHLSAGGTTWSYPPACLFPYKENQAINQSAR